MAEWMTMSDDPTHVEVLAVEDLASGAWTSEAEACVRTGLTPLALKRRRQRSSIEARPTTVDARGPRGYWYRTADIDRIAGAGATPLPGPSVQVPPTEPDGMLAELELAMARAEAKEHELAVVRTERDAARAEAARLRVLVSGLTRAIEASVDSEGHIGPGRQR